MSNAVELPVAGEAARARAQPAPGVLLVVDGTWARIGAAFGGSRMPVTMATPAADPVVLVRALRPDVVVVAIDSPRRALRLVADFVEASPHVAVIVVGLPEVDADFLAIVRAGAVGYLPAEISTQALLRAVRAAADGRTAFPRTLTRALADAFHEDAHRVDNPSREHSTEAELTEREWQVLHLMWQGRTTRQIADRLFISSATVRSHLAAIRRKLGVSSTSAMLELVWSTRS